MSASKLNWSHTPKLYRGKAYTLVGANSEKRVHRRSSVTLKQSQRNIIFYSLDEKLASAQCDERLTTECTAGSAQDQCWTDSHPGASLLDYRQNTKSPPVSCDKVQ